MGAPRGYRKGEVFKGRTRKSQTEKRIILGELVFLWGKGSYEVITSCFFGGWGGAM